MKHWLMVGVLLLGLIGRAQAEWQAGISLGRGNYSGELFPVSSSFVVGQDESAVTSFKVFLGAPVNEHLAVLAGYQSLGTYSRQAVNSTTEMQGDLSFKGFFAESRWQWRSGMAVRPYVKLAMMLASIDAGYQLRSIVPPTAVLVLEREQQSQALFVPGAGIMLESGSGWGVQLEFENFSSIEGTASQKKQSVSVAGLGVYGFW